MCLCLQGRIGSKHVLAYVREDNTYRYQYICVYSSGKQCIHICTYICLCLQRQIGSRHVLTYVCMHAVFIFIYIQHIYMYAQIHVRDLCTTCGVSGFGAHMILNSFFGWYRNVNDSETNMSADVQSSQSRVAIRESCTGTCDIIPVVNDILRIF